jgi:hypothetical protein
MSSKRPLSPLTREHLRAIWECNPLPVVRRLLWEIHRLRALVLRANDFARMAAYHHLERHMDTTSRSLLEGLRDSLKDEPVVKEDEVRRMDR